MVMAPTPLLRRTPPSPQGRRIPAYVLSWTAAGIVASGAVLALFPASSPEPARGGLLAALVFLVATTAAEGFSLRLSHGRAVEAITLIEAAVAANILLFPPAWALGITLGGIAVAQVVQRRPPTKLVFNLGQLAAATSAALAVDHLIRSGTPAASIRGLGGILLGMAVFGVVNFSAVWGILSRVEGRPFRAILREGIRFSVITLMGNTTVGILAGVLWQTRPELTPLLLVPAFTLHLAYRGVVRTDELLATVSAERDRLDRIVVGASDGIVLLDFEGTVEVWSPEMGTLTGIAPEEAVGRPAAEVLAGKDPAGRPIDLMEQVMATDPDHPVMVTEMTLPHREGGEHIVLARQTALFDEHGARSGYVVLVHDVTRQREVEAMKDDFVARVSHELRTPLTPIKGYAQTLLRRGDDIPRDKRNEVLAAMVERSDHMARLIEDLLLVTRISAGRASLADQFRPEPVDLAALADRVVGPFRTTHPQRAFEVEADPGLAPALADPLRAEQVVANLLSNACKYSPDGSPVSVRVWGAARDRIALSVTDRGRGIPPDQIERVFARFHRLENPLTMTTGGLGLGLYISRQFAEAMGGSLTAISRLDEGSTFTLTLPTAHDA